MSYFRLAAAPQEIARAIEQCLLHRLDDEGAPELEHLFIRHGGNALMKIIYLEEANHQVHSSATVNLVSLNGNDELEVTLEWVVSRGENSRVTIKRPLMRDGAVHWGVPWVGRYLALFFTQGQDQRLADLVWYSNTIVPWLDDWNTNLGRTPPPLPNIFKEKT